MEQPFLKVLACQTSWLKSGKTKSNKTMSEGEVVLLNVQKCDSSKVFPSDNQHDSDATFPQGGVGLEKVDPKNTSPYPTDIRLRR
ncbi:unnamed protein product [Schistosoma margrebowiei]|uniref:Uncharacterized protein n=1 Tax=Schistosoma margrebowiei TaxID=48269 RepID=A0A3P7YEX8_9TREM|nr:unnamed protein product [Schistosoma margrebowiei]